MSQFESVDLRPPTLHEWYHVKINVSSCQECSDRLNRLRQTVACDIVEGHRLSEPPIVSLQPQRLQDDNDISNLDIGPSYYSYVIIPGQEGESKLRALANTISLKMKKSYRALRARKLWSRAEN